MKVFEIWIGNYSLGQGYSSPTEPDLLAEIESVDFKTACIKYELISKLKRLEEGEVKGNLNSQDYPWWFHENSISNSWTGKYYESKEEALKSFKNK